MALQKTAEAESGVHGNYWKITKVIHHRTIQKTECELELYKDVAAVAADKTPIVGIPKKTRWMDDESAEGATVAECYINIKTQAMAEDTDDNYFADAEDV